MAWAHERGLAGAPAPFYGVCPDDPDVTAEENLRFDACVCVGPGFEPDDSVALGEIPAGTYVVALLRRTAPSRWFDMGRAAFRRWFDMGRAARAG